MAQGQWATQQSATAIQAVSALEGALFARGYVPQYASGTAGGINEQGLIADAVNALLNCAPQSVTFSWTPSLVSNAVVAEQTVTLTGIGLTAAAGDRVLVTYPGAPTANVGMCMGARVSTGGLNPIISVPFVNPTAGSLTPPSGTYTFTFLRT
jgi:hypothetical protein